MPRVNMVKRTRDQRKCGRCQSVILIGELYRWAKKRYGPKMVRCMKPDCHFRQSELTSSDKLSRIYAAEENIGVAVATFRNCTKRDEFEAARDALVSDIESERDEVQSVSEEYEESSQNIEEHFPGSEQASEIQEKAEAAQTICDNMDTALDQFRERELEENESVEDVVEEICGEVEGIDYDMP